MRELIGQREQLETFCRRHGDLFNNQIIDDKDLERGKIHGTERAEREATAEKIKAGKIG